MSLVTGYSVDRKKWTVLPLPNHIIQLAEDTTALQKEPVMCYIMRIFEWRPGMLISDDIDDEKEDEPIVQLEERHVNDEDELMDGDKEESDAHDGER